MSPSTSENAVGFHLGMRELFERYENLEKYLVGDRIKKIYCSARRQFEAGLKCDFIEISKEVGGNGNADSVSLEYIASLMGGIPKGQPYFADQTIAHLMLDYHKKELQKAHNRAIASPVFDFQEIREIMSKIEELQEGIVGSTKIEPVLIRLSEVEPRPIKWLWRDRIPRAKITLFGGDPGVGKSYLSDDLIARITTGREAPGTGQLFESGSALILTAEDGLSDTVRIRMDLLGADVSKIIILDAIREGGKTKTFSLSQNLPTLDNVFRENSDLQICVIDPFTSFLGGRDADASSDTRAITDPLSRLTESSGVAAILIGHLNKSETMQRALHRFSHSKDWTAASRTVWLIERDALDENEERRLFVCVKNNLVKHPPALSFRISDSGIRDYEVIHERVQADEILQMKTGDRTALKQAVDWLKQALAEGPTEAREIFRSGEANGFSDITLRRAKTKLGAKAYSSGFGTAKIWYWSL